MQITKRELIEHCLTFVHVFEDYPFDESTAVIRHEGNKKMFALIDIRNDILSINLKCDPVKAVLLRTLYKSVVSGGHMNKAHWNTVRLDGDVPFEELHNMISDSYELTKSKLTRKPVVS